MPFDDDDDDLFGQDFDFVDDDEDDDEVSESADEADSSDDVTEEPEPVKPKRQNRRGGKPSSKHSSKPRGEANAEKPASRKPAAEKPASEKADSKEADKEQAAPEPAAEKAKEEPVKPPSPPTDHVVHLYEYRKFTRTVKREFTSEEAEAFATEFNRTSAAHSRKAIAANRDETPAETTTDHLRV